jgi:YidC/Oxa1 family membrane protein insertase
VGFWNAILDAVFAVLKWIHGFAGDWGLAIIIITVIFRLLISPITHKQFKSTFHMQKLQPKLKEIQQKYAGDRTRLQEEQMKLYQEAKFNPLSGCLPMFLQMPIFMALYGVLANAFKATADHTPWIELDKPASFFGLVPDISLSLKAVFTGGYSILEILPFALLVLLFAVSMFLPMLVNKTKDRNTIIMTSVMAVFMLFIGWQAPAGVLLYWDTSSLIGVAQQGITMSYLRRKDAVAEAEVIDIKPVKVEIERAPKKPRPRKGGK